MFNPIRIHMRHSKVPSAAARRMREGGSHIRRTPTPLGPGQVACVYGGRGEELVLKVGSGRGRRGNSVAGQMD